MDQLKKTLLRAGSAGVSTLCARGRHAGSHALLPLHHSLATRPGLGLLFRRHWSAERRTRRRADGAPGGCAERANRANRLASRQAWPRRGGLTASKRDACSCHARDSAAARGVGTAARVRPTTCYPLLCYPCCDVCACIRLVWRMRYAHHSLGGVLESYVAYCIFTRHGQDVREHHNSACPP